MYNIIPTQNVKQTWTCAFNQEKETSFSPRPSSHSQTKPYICGKNKLQVSLAMGVS